MRGPDYDAWVYDCLHKEALGATTQRDLILAQERIVLGLGEPDKAAEIRHKLSAFSTEYLDSGIFDGPLPNQFFA